MIYVYESLSFRPYKPKKKKTKLGRPKRRRLICHAVAVYASTIAVHRLTPFDTDSSSIGSTIEHQDVFPRGH